MRAAAFRRSRLSDDDGLRWFDSGGVTKRSHDSRSSVNGEEFVAMASGGGDQGRRGGDLILSFALPKP
jgi:hypothetical protein